jgi:tetratricopeptide (TPR) repeat protein
LINFLCYIFIFFQFQTADLKFFKGTFEEAKTASKNENKSLLLLFYENWDKNFEKILNDQGIISLTNNFINFQVKLKENAGVLITKIYSAESYPMIILCNSEGKEIDRLIKPKDSKDLLNNLKNMASNINTLDYYLNELTNEPENPKINFEIAKKYLDRDEKEKATKYFYNTLKYDEKRKIDIGEYPYYLVSVRELKEGKPETSNEFLKLYPKSKYLNFVYLSLADHYLKTANYEYAWNTYGEYLKKYPDDHVALNNYAYLSAMLNKDLDKAMTCVEKAIKLVNEIITKANYLDTKAEIYFKMKKYSEAADTAKMAIEMLGNGNARERSEIEDHLRKYQNSMK